MTDRTAADLTTRIRRLATRHSLPAASVEQLACLIELLAADAHAPTAIRDPLAAVDHHLADSLAALDLEPVQAATSVADLGSGAGFPGLALAIALPHARVALLEANHRKCAFLDRVSAACDVTNARTVSVRAETWTEGLRTLDLVTARAVAPLAVVAEYAAPLLRVGGTLVVWRGRPDPEGERASALAGSELGFEVHTPVRVHPFAGAEHRYLHVMTKVAPTPARFPRRPGVALKRPLGSLHPVVTRAPISSDRERR